MNILVETCAGSAAVARKLCGVGKLISYMGGKEGYAEAILREWNPPQPDLVILNDPGYWGLIWEGLLKNQAEVVRELIKLTKIPAVEIFNRACQVAGQAESNPLNTALALCRIAGTFGGGEIGGFKGKHKHRPNVDGFIPNRNTLAQRVSKISWPVKVNVIRKCATLLDVPLNSWVYIDPPYVGTSGYVNKLERSIVISLAEKWKNISSSVAISEAETIPLPDWKSVCLTKNRQGQLRRNTRSAEEYLTYHARLN